jgi:molecular chaperone GrpE
MTESDVTRPEAAGADGAPGDSAAALQQERDEIYERLLRTAAEFENYRRRIDRERRDLSDAAAADLLRDLLPVIDDLERALAAPVPSKPDAAPFMRLRQGVELIHRELLEVLRRRGVEPFESVGRDFDPSWHEAVAAEPANGRRDGEIIDEIRRGYRLGSRLLRPAIVRVAKA